MKHQIPIFQILLQWEYYGSGYTGKFGEIIFDLYTNMLYRHDGVTPNGIPIKIDSKNIVDSTNILVNQFIKLTDTPGAYPSTDIGKGLIASNSAVKFSNSFGSDDTGFYHNTLGSLTYGDELFGGGNATFEDAKYYKIEVVISGMTQGSSELQIDGTAIETFSENGTHKVVYLSSFIGSKSVAVVGDVDFDGTIDSISVTEIFVDKGNTVRYIDAARNDLMNIEVYRDEYDSEQVRFKFDSEFLAYDSKNERILSQYQLATTKNLILGFGENQYTFPSAKGTEGQSLSLDANGNLVWGDNSASWGNITGTVTDQTDLISYLNSNYAAINHEHTNYDKYEYWQLKVDGVHKKYLFKKNYIDLNGGTNITLSYDDTANKVIINANLGIAWGNITGNVENQTDLITYLGNNYDKYSHWRLYINGSFADYVTKSDILDFQGGTNITLSYSNGVVTISASSGLWTAVTGGIEYTSGLVGIGSSYDSGSNANLAIGSGGIESAGGIRTAAWQTAGSGFRLINLNGTINVIDADGNVSSANAVADGTYNNPTAITVVGGIITGITV